MTEPSKNCYAINNQATTIVIIIHYHSLMDVLECEQEIFILNSTNMGIVISLF